MSALVLFVRVESFLSASASGQLRSLSCKWASPAPAAKDTPGPETVEAASGPVWEGGSEYEVGMGAPEEGGMGEVLQDLLDAAKLNFFNAKEKGEKDRNIRNAAYADYEDFGGSNVKEGLRSYRKHAKLGMQCFMEQNLKGAIEEFDKAAQANASQALVQRGIALYIDGRYEDAIAQLTKDVQLAENKNVQAFKATDTRIWLSAAYSRIGKPTEAIDALDIDSDLKEQRYLMSQILLLFAGQRSLEEVLEVVGGVEGPDLLGTQFYGNFYIALYFDGMKEGEGELAQTFLRYPATSPKFRNDDMWYHVPRLLYKARYPADYDDETMASD